MNPSAPCTLQCCQVHWLSGRRAVTPAWTTAPAVGADADAADNRSGASRSATCPGWSGECSSRQLFVGVKNLHAKRQTSSFEFR